MSGKGKGLKNKALAAVRTTLAKHGFPDNLQLKQRRTRPEGIRYSAIGKQGNKTVSLAILLYDPKTGIATLEKDCRDEIEGDVQGVHTSPVDAVWQKAWPEVKLHVRDQFDDVFVAWLEPSDNWPVRGFARLVVTDKQNMRHVVHCVRVEDKVQVQKLTKLLNTTQRLHTCLILWGPKSTSKAAADEIIKVVKNWRQRSWPKPK